jgi:hypothetical protein
MAGPQAFFGTLDTPQIAFFPALLAGKQAFFGNQLF